MSGTLDQRVREIVKEILSESKSDTSVRKALDRAGDNVVDVDSTGSASVRGEAAVSLSQFEPNSIASAQRRVFAIARTWQQVPDEMGDGEALAQGLITPEMIMLILSMLPDLLACLSNRSAAAMSRIRAYQNAGSEMNRMADTIRFNWLIDRAMYRMGHLRSSGDVNSLRLAFVQDSETLDERTYQGIQRELLFLTI